MNCGYCQGITSEVRRRVIQGGGMQFRHQCLTCGRATSNSISRLLISNSDRIREWDYELNDRYEQNKGEKHAIEQDVARTEWLKEHTAYLKTEGWRLLRAAVLKRANGYCEGCGKTFATQVHHLSYENWKQEFLWELVAICDRCHERIHPHMQEDKAEGHF